MRRRRAEDTPYQQTRRVSRARARRQCHIHSHHLLTALSEHLPSSLTLAEVLREVTCGAGQLLQVPAVSLWGVDELDSTLRLLATWGTLLPATAVPASLSFQQDALGWVARHRQPLLVADLTAETRFVPLAHWGQQGLRSFAGFPVFLDETYFAVLALHNTHPVVLTPRQQHVLRFFLSQARVALHNAWLYMHENTTRQVTASSLYTQATMTVRHASLHATETMAREAMATATRAKNALLANMSHELRTPLNAIINYCEILEEDTTDQGHLQYVKDLKKIHMAGKQLLGHVNDILEFVRVEAGECQVEHVAFDIPQLVHDVLTAIQPLAAKNANVLESHITEDVHVLYGDRDKVQQSLVHLLSNACKFTSQGRVTLTVAQETGQAQAWICFQVRDTGIGMSPEQVERLFQPFMQADDSSTRKYEGTGMGLAMSQRLCQMMGGEITVVSTAGEGSTFSMYLPVASPARTTAS